MTIRPFSLAKSVASWLLVSLPIVCTGEIFRESILDIASDIPELSTFVDLVYQAKLDSVLDDLALELTVFAPSNDAFESLDTGVLRSLLNMKSELADVLLFHIIDGEVFSDDLKKGNCYLPLLNRGDLCITSLFPPKVNDVRVIELDYIAANGVLHILKEVLIPPPSTVDDYHPPVEDDYHPTEGDDYEPPVEDDYHPTTEGDDYKPPTEDDYHPTEGDDYKPPVEDDYHPTEGDDYKPPVEDDYHPTDDMPHLAYMGNDGKPSIYFPLENCEGDCDSDTDCKGKLVCFDDGHATTVPGCKGEREVYNGKKVDYCYMPKVY